MSLWSLFGLLIGAVLAADLVRSPLKKALRKCYEWLEAKSPKLAQAIDSFLAFMSDAFGPGNDSS
ncbi:MAG: hypothetical protein ABC578_06180 [Candidatus Methanosuratincola petrocarbonis]